MTNLSQIDIFPSILKKLPLNDLIILRRVCHQWKEWIEDYLKRQTVLLLINDCYLGENHKMLSGRSQTLNITYSKIILNKLVLNTRCLERKWSNFAFSVANSLLRLFPNIEELYIFVEQEQTYYKHLNYEIMLRGWKSTLKKLIIPDLYNNHSSGIIKCLSKCSKLETLGMFKDYDYEEYEEEYTDTQQDIKSERIFENVLRQLTSFWMPPSKGEFYQNQVTNITAIADVDTRFDGFPSSRFPNIHRMFLYSLNFYSGKLNNRIIENLQRLASWKHGKLCCLEIKVICFEMSWYDDVNLYDEVLWCDETFEESRYPPFFAELNLCRSVKTLKLEIEHPVVLEYILKNSADFDYVEMLIINYKNMGMFAVDKPVLRLPDNFEELLPKRVNRIHNMEFHLEPQNCEKFRKAVFPEFPYKVKISHDL